MLEKALGEGDWLVRNGCTYADLSFIAWQRWGAKSGGADLCEEYPSVDAWMKHMEARETVQKVHRDQNEVIAELEARGENWEAITGLKRKE